MQSRDSNQRDFYRVDCPVIFSYRVAGDGIPGIRTADSFFPDNEHFNLLRELRHIDHDSNHLLHAIGEQDRNLSAYLSHMNRKIDTLARHMASLTPEMSKGDEQNVSLSEGGIVVRCAEPPPADKVLALRITLLPSYVGLTTFASVVKVGAKEATGAQVFLNFERLQDTDRQIIARHVMQVQMADQRRKSGH